MTVEYCYDYSPTSAALNSVDVDFGQPGTATAAAITSMINRCQSI